MNYHEKLEEYINIHKYNQKNHSKINEEKTDTTIKLTNRGGHKESSNFSLVDESCNNKTTTNLNSNTFVIGNNLNNNNFTYGMDSYKYSANKISDYLPNTSILSHHNLTSIEIKKPNFTESLAYHTRNYSNIVKDCLNFDEISYCAKYDVNKFLPNKADDTKSELDKAKILKYRNINITKIENKNNNKIDVDKNDSIDLANETYKKKKKNKLYKKEEFENDKKKYIKKNKEIKFNRIDENLEINSLRSFDSEISNNDTKKKGKLRNKNTKIELESLPENNSNQSQYKKNKSSKDSSILEKFERELTLDDLNDKNNNKKEKKTNDGKKKQIQFNKCSSMSSEEDDSFEMAKEFFKVFLYNIENRKNITEFSKKKGNRVRRNKDVDDFSESSNSFTEETNSQSSSSLNESVIFEFNGNLEWHKLDFEIEFGKNTDKIKDKFLNFQI